MRCCILSYRTRLYRVAAGACTQKNSTGANVNSQGIGVPDTGRKKTCRVFSASRPLRNHVSACSAPFGGCWLGTWLRRRGRRRYVLFDEVPERCREQERDQLRAPVFQNQSLHICCAIKSPRSVAGRSPE